MYLQSTEAFCSHRADTQICAKDRFEAVFLLLQAVGSKEKAWTQAGDSAPLQQERQTGNRTGLCHTLCGQQTDRAVGQAGRR